MKLNTLPAGLKSRLRHFFALLFLLLIPYLSLAKVQNFDYVTWDDDLYVYNNPSIRQLSLENAIQWFTQPYAALYNPLPVMTLALDYQLWDNRAEGYHRTNLAIYLANCLLAYGILHALLNNAAFAFLGALLFALHPVQMDNLGWISQRKSLLMVFFFFSGFLLLIKGYGRSGSNKKYALFVLVLFLASLLCKVTAAGIPFIVAAYYYFYRPAEWKNAVPFLLWMIVPVGLVAAVTLLYYPAVLRFLGDLFTFSNLTQRIGSFFLYGKLAVYPMDLTLFYAYPDWGRGLRFFAFCAAALALLVFLADAVLRRRPYGFWLVWFVVFLLPAASLFPLPVGHRHLYVSLLGMIGFILTVIQPFRRTALWLTATLVLLCVPLANARLEVWRNGETFWKNFKRPAGAGPRSAVQFRADLQLALHYERTGKYDEAIRIYESMIMRSCPEPFPYLNAYAICRKTQNRGCQVRLERKWRMFYTRNPGKTLDKFYDRLVADRKQPEKIYARIRTLVREHHAEVSWRRDYAQKIRQAKKLLAQGRRSEAVAIFETLTRERHLLPHAFLHLYHLYRSEGKRFKLYSVLRSWHRYYSKTYSLKRLHKLLMRSRRNLSKIYYWLNDAVEHRMRERGFRYRKRAGLFILFNPSGDYDLLFFPAPGEN